MSWIAKTPYIPTFLSDDFTHLLGNAHHSRIGLIVQRQVRFLNDLATTRIPGATYDMRLSFAPGQKQVDIVFLGKAGGDNETEARQACERSWEKFQAHFPSEAPFGYPLERQDDDPSLEDVRCPKWISSEQPSVVEVHKHVDTNPMSDVPTLMWGTYPHPFVPSFDFGALGKFMEVLVQQKAPTIVSICLRPTVLPDEDVRQMQREVTQYEDRLRKWPAQPKDQNGSETRIPGWRILYEMQRLKAMQEAVLPYLEPGKRLFLFKVQIVSQGPPALALADALGSELTDNTGTTRARLWEAVVPKGEALKIALTNFKDMEYKPWHLLTEEMGQLPMLCTAREAAGIFRLPIPPESGYMPGLRVQDEPFVAPQGLDANGTKQDDVEETVRVGKVLHRGLSTGMAFTVSPAMLRRHTLIAGSTGSGKTNTALLLLSRLWAELKVPFLVLYPVDKPDYRQLWLDKKITPSLLYFTVGDSTTTPLRFNPFAVPQGVLLRTHISRLLQVFITAYEIWDPVPVIYREALREAYRRKGWDLERGKGGDAEPPTLGEFFAAMMEAAETLTQGYGEEVRGNVRQASEIRMRDLLLNAGPTVDVKEPLPWDDILFNPTVLELARLGSDEDIALVMGMLLISLIGELTSRQQRSTSIESKLSVGNLSSEETLKARQQLHLAPPFHLTLLEEAHRLMPGKVSELGVRATLAQQSSKMFDRLLAEVRGLNEGLIIAEQMPTRLVGGAIGNTYLKIMHWLEDVPSFETFSHILSLNDRQQARARLLQPGEALTRSPQGRPMQIKVDHFSVPSAVISDELIRNLMQKKGVGLASYTPARFEIACEYCRVPCLWGDFVEYARNLDLQRVAEDIELTNALIESNVLALRQAALNQSEVLGKRDPDVAYCLLAHIADSPFVRDLFLKDGEMRKGYYSALMFMLRVFHRQKSE